MGKRKLEIKSKTLNNTNTNQNNKFIEIVNMCFKFSLLEYLIDLNKYSNQSADACNFRSVCKKICEITEKGFFGSALIKWPDNFDKNKLKMIKHIEFNGDEPDTNLSQYFPNLVEIVFHDKFNKPLEKDSLPCTLQCIRFGDSFDQPLKKDSLPCTLQCLTFGRDFDQLLEKGMLPCELRELTFG